MSLCHRLCVLVLCGLMGACTVDTPTFKLPDRSDPEVKQEEERVAAVLAAEDTGLLADWDADGPAECKVRLLRKVGSTDYVYARCMAGQQGLSVPLRLDDGIVTIPADGAGWSPSVRQIFPADIAAALIEDTERYRP